MNRFIKILLSAYALLSPTLTQAQITEGNECPKEMIVSYFPEKFVDETLAKFKVPEDQREGIKADLAEKDKQIVSIVEEKGAAMDPNPLRDPALREEAVKIFRETLYSAFSEVMIAHGFDDKEKIQDMLDDIQYQKAKFFSACMEKYEPNIQVEEDLDDDLEGDPAE